MRKTPYTDAELPAMQPKIPSTNSPIPCTQENALIFSQFKWKQKINTVSVNGTSSCIQIRDTKTMAFNNYTCKPILRLKMNAGGGVAPESRAAAKKAPVDCTKTEFKCQISNATTGFSFSLN